jgi:hypothetical protein
MHSQYCQLARAQLTSSNGSAALQPQRAAGSIWRR